MKDEKAIETEAKHLKFFDQSQLIMNSKSYTGLILLFPDFNSVPVRDLDTCDEACWKRWKTILRKNFRRNNKKHEEENKSTRDLQTLFIGMINEGLPIPSFLKVPQFPYTTMKYFKNRDRQ